MILLSVCLFTSECWALIPVEPYRTVRARGFFRIFGAARQKDSTPNNDSVLPTEESTILSITDEKEKKPRARIGKGKSNDESSLQKSKQSTMNKESPSAGQEDKDVTISGVGTKKKKKKGGDEIPYWLNETDTVSSEVVGEKCRSIRFQIRGNPRPLVRHRTSRGIVYNPSSGLQTSFRDVTFQILEDLGYNRVPLFEEEDALSMVLVFRMKRAKNHFLRGIPGPGRLKENAPKATAPIRNDIDNLCKFVLDSMNKVLYPDDRQITSIHIIKMLDDQEPYTGSTELYLRAIQEEDLETIIVNSFQITRASKLISPP